MQRRWETWTKMRELMTLDQGGWMARCEKMRERLPTDQYERDYGEFLVGRTWWATTREVHCFRYHDLSEIIAAAIRSRFERNLAESLPCLEQSISRGEPWATVIQVDGEPTQSGVDRLAAVTVAFDGEALIFLAELVGPDGESNTALWCMDFQGKLYAGTVLGKLMKTCPPSERRKLHEEMNDITYAALSLLWAIGSPITRVESEKPKGRLTRKKRAAVMADRPRVKRVTLLPRPFHQPPGLSRLMPASSGGSCVPGRERGASWAPEHTGIRWVREDNVRDTDELLDLKEGANGKILYACVRKIQGWGDVPDAPRKTVYNAVSIYNQS